MDADVDAKVVPRQLVKLASAAVEKAASADVSRENHAPAAVAAATQTSSSIRMSIPVVMDATVAATKSVAADVEALATAAVEAPVTADVEAPVTADVEAPVTADVAVEEDAATAATPVPIAAENHQNAAALISLVALILPSSNAQKPAVAAAVDFNY